MLFLFLHVVTLFVFIMRTFPVRERTDRDSVRIAEMSSQFLFGLFVLVEVVEKLDESEKERVMK